MKLLVDSCSDISLDFAKEHQLFFIPLKINVDGKEYLDKYEISSEEVSKAVDDGIRPLTSQANPEELYNHFNEALKEDSTIIYLSFSSQLSGTYQSANIARDMILEERDDVDITVIDSLSASYGYGLLVERATKYVNDGLSKEEVIKNIERDKAHIRHLFTVSDLDYLAKGGRLSKGQAFLGSLLNIRPLLHVEDGKLVPIEKYRGVKRVLKRMVELMKEEGAATEVHITHADNLKDAEALKNLILKETDLTNVQISSIGPTIISHTGNGTIALFYFTEGV
uniref:DegV family protein n=1 Tax=Nosocomiicoccus ampullae TaxID=489910 RepID=UPI000829F67F|nr:DegV family protein [Nosocomiicoccus ampullae]